MNRFNNIIYPNLIINAQYQQMRVTIPISVDRTLVRIHCFRLKGAPDEMFHRAVRFLTTLGSPASMIFSDDVEMLERCQQRTRQGYRPVGRFLARTRQRPRERGRQRLGRRKRNADARAVPGLGEIHDGRGGLMLPYETLRQIELFVLRGSAPAGRGRVRGLARSLCAARHLLDAEQARPDRSAERRVDHLRGSRDPFDPGAAAAGGARAGADANATHRASGQQHRGAGRRSWRTNSRSAPPSCASSIQGERQRIYSGRQIHHIDAA